ncbi:glycerol-3-phosphate dehydrogenase/oxidase [Calditrichota bacterium LG25]
MNRDYFVQQLERSADSPWDVLIIGGGATGLGCAVDSATRGFKTLLVEQADFAKGTSSRSTKLVHGGVRYLAQGDVSLVFEALHERGLLMQNAPHLVKNQPFIIPLYEWWEGPFYNIGMKVYDLMAGKLGFGPSEKLSKEETLNAIPNLDQHGLMGGVIYFDGQFDDARLAVNLAQTAVDHGATVLNYFKVIELLKDASGLLEGVVIRDMESGQNFTVKARAVINATGVFSDQIRQLDEPGMPPSIVPSQGVHLMVDQSFLQGNSSIMIPHTDDGRVLFAVPWHNEVIIGTTDTPVNEVTLEPRAKDEEIEFLLTTSARYLKKDPLASDVLSVFAGLRPLAAPQGSAAKTKDISRRHQITISRSGLITVTGGKWTTYRKMAQETIDRAVLVGGLQEKDCVTKQLPIHGYRLNTHFDEPLYYYGADRPQIESLLNGQPTLGERLHPALPYLKAEVIWATRQEMARTVEDFLARRSRALFLSARASMEMAPIVAQLMAGELNQSNQWIEKQIEQFKNLAKHYLLE